MYVWTPRCRGAACLRPNIGDRCPNHRDRIDTNWPNHFGQIIEKQWDDIPNQFKTVDIDEFVIMPNHIHGILIINNRAEASAAPTLSLIIRSFKSKCTMEYLRHINENNLNASAKIWQRSFHDHIIRNDESFEKIRNYIRNNPSTWNEDKNNLSYNNQLQPTAKRGG